MTAVFTCARGFGIVVTKSVASNVFIANGLIELDYEEPHYTVKGGGTMYGPAALINAACSEQCANAIFRRKGDVWNVTTTRGLRAGEEVLVYYPSRGVCVCSSEERDWT